MGAAPYVVTPHTPSHFRIRMGSLKQLKRKVRRDEGERK